MISNMMTENIKQLEYTHGSFWYVFFWRYGGKQMHVYPLLRLILQNQRFAWFHCGFSGSKVETEIS